MHVAIDLGSTYVRISGNNYSITVNLAFTNVTCYDEDRF